VGINRIALLVYERLGYVRITRRDLFMGVSKGFPVGLHKGILVGVKEIGVEEKLPESLRAKFRGNTNAGFECPLQDPHKPGVTLDADVEDRKAKAVLLSIA